MDRPSSRLLEMDQEVREVVGHWFPFPFLSDFTVLAVSLMISRIKLVMKEKETKRQEFLHVVVSRSLRTAGISILS